MKEKHTKNIKGKLLLKKICHKRAGARYLFRRPNYGTFVQYEHTYLRNFCTRRNRSSVKLRITWLTLFFPYKS